MMNRFLVGCVRVVLVLILATFATSCARDHGVSSTAPTPVPSPSASPQPSRQLTITGLVREVNGGPLADAAIYAYASGRRTNPQVASTAADGSFRLEQFVDDGLWFRVNGAAPRGRPGFSGIFADEPHTPRESRRDRGARPLRPRRCAAQAAGCHADRDRRQTVAPPGHDPPSWIYSGSRVGTRVGPKLGTIPRSACARSRQIRVERG